MADVEKFEKILIPQHKWRAIMSKYQNFLRWVAAATEANREGRAVYDLKSREAVAWGFV